MEISNVITDRSVALLNVKCWFMYLIYGSHTSRMLLQRGVEDVGHVTLQYLISI